MSTAAGKCTKRPPYSRLGWGVGDFRTSVAVIIIASPGSELAAATGPSAFAQFQADLLLAQNSKQIFPK